MNTEKVYLVGVHRYCFRAGEKCEIVGVEYVQPSDDADYRLAYKVKYDDDVIDWVAFTDVEAGNWEFVYQLEAGLVADILFQKPIRINGVQKSKIYQR